MEPPAPPTAAAATPAPSDAATTTPHAHTLAVEKNTHNGTLAVEENTSSGAAAPAIFSAAAVAQIAVATTYHINTVVTEPVSGPNPTHNPETCAHKKWPFQVQPVKFGKGGLGQFYCCIMPIAQTQIRLLTF